ncbi:voltage-dependent calcium channel gamma-6 subunit [Piliocolobus tephrosceles]|uniref:voltage-dependent calcium channel gamma-6 subunit n=1 Tax=Piliocolobus tephrosceles TaxID=591936 RepID=UPI000C29B20B|nr:voltage-dependent calcium channel gamma-6 subunit [Piliocolobus tephrosceles]
MMMWSNFFLQEENRRRRAHGRGRSGLTPEREGKVKLALLLAAVGATLAVLSVGTEFWVELNTYKANGSAVCEAAHLGLWKVCTKRLWQADVPADRDTCGPAELPGEANCTYFKFFTTGENARIFQRTTKKDVNLAAAVIAVLGLVVMALGCLCIIMVLTKGAEFLLRVGAVCFGLSGEGSEPGG